MKFFISFLIAQELTYGAVVAVVCVLIGFDKEADVGFRAFAYLMLLLQFVIIWDNRKLIKSVLFGRK